MTGRTTSILAILTALGGGLLLGSAAQAQTVAAQEVQAETPAQARARSATSSLNAGPAETTLAPRVNALPPLTDAERPHPVRPLTRIAPEPEPVQAEVRLPARAPLQNSVKIQAEVQAPAAAPAISAAAAAASSAAPQAAAGPRAPSITLAAGATAPDPIAMPLGYYVRGDKACNQVWPGEGDLAWFTPTAFTIDFGGCEPGQFMQTGPNAWTEEQQCMTELGGDAGAYNVSYEVVEPGVVQRRATLEIDGHVEEDVWKHCDAADVPEEARFKD